MMITKKTFIGLLALCSLGGSAMAADWPVWRGTNADGISTEAIKPSGDIAWTSDLGKGYSSVTVHNGKLFAAGNVDGTDVVYCLDPETGKEIWTYKYASDPDRSFSGPMATPVTDGEFVWFFSRHGEMMCLAAATGEKIWSTSLVSESSPNPQWKAASSVVIYKDMALVGFGASGAAVDKKTGKLLWSSDGASTYSTPSVMNYKGKDYLIVMGGKTLSLVDIADGTVIDQLEYPQDCEVVGCSPIIIDAEKGQFYVSCGYSLGRSELFAFDGAKITTVWTVKHLNSMFSTPAYKDGVIYGSHGNTNARDAITAIDAKTGEKLWSGSLRFGSPTIAGETLVYLDERGTLSFLKLDKTKEDIIDSFRVIKKGKCWQVPVVANGYVYCRNDAGTLVAVKVK